MKYLITAVNTCSGQNAVSKIVEEWTRERAIEQAHDFEDHMNEVSGDALNSYKLARVLNLIDHAYVYFDEDLTQNRSRTKEDLLKDDLFTADLHLDLNL